MSAENVARLKTMIEAFNRGDFDTAVKIAHPEVEFIRFGEGTIRGVEALRAWMEPDALEGHQVEPLDFRVNGSSVLVHQRHRARGAESGIEVKAEAWSVYTFDDEGRVTRLQSFLEHDKALEAAGLAE
jgi:ketosteroid isomerase-like protein